jgi:hypothetical protein
MVKQCRQAVSLIILSAALPVAGIAQDARTVLGNAARAMGAENLKTVVYSGSGTEFAFGQAWNPNSAWPGYRSKAYTGGVNFETPAWRTDRVLDATSPSCVGCSAAQQDRGGALPPGPTETVVVDAKTGWADYCILPWFNCRRHVDFWTTPYGFLKTAGANDPTVMSQTIGGKKYSIVTFTGQNRAKVDR